MVACRVRRSLSPTTAVAATVVSSAQPERSLKASPARSIKARSLRTAFRSSATTPISSRPCARHASIVWAAAQADSSIDWAAINLRFSCGTGSSRVCASWGEKNQTEISSRATLNSVMAIAISLADGARPIQNQTGEVSVRCAFAQAARSVGNWLWACKFLKVLKSEARCFASWPA